MSTRSRALAYANTVRESQKKRPQPSNYSKAGPSKPMPAELMSKRNELDDIADESRKTRQQEDAIKDDEKERIVDSSDFEPAKQSSKQMPSTATTVNKKPAEPVLNSVYRDCWTTTSDVVIPPETFDEKSSFTPNFISYFEAIFAMEDLLYNNEELKYVARAYFSLPVRLYYAVIGIVTIYRAKEIANTLTKAEGSWLRMFRRSYPEESLPIAAPLIPILQNIATHAPDDSQYAYVYPTFPSTGTYSATPGENEGPSTLNVDSSHYFIPSVAMLGDLLKIFCTLPAITEANFDVNGNFVPFNPTEGGNFAGVTFPPIGDGYNRNFSKFLLNPALSRSLPESKAHLREIHQYWRRTRARYFPSPAANNGFNPNSPDDFMFSAQNLEWFGSCRDMATKQVKFFAHSTNLSTISTLSDQASVVQVHLKLPSEVTNTQETLTEWFPDSYRNVRALFRSTSAELELDRIMQAAYAVTNASMSWLDSNNHHVGSKESNMRSGPFWDNTKYNYISRHEQLVLRGYETMIQSHFYNAHATEPSSF